MTLRKYLLWLLVAALFGIELNGAIDIVDEWQRFL
jgi:hypothetical protein